MNNKLTFTVAAIVARAHAQCVSQMEPPLQDIPFGYRVQGEVNFGYLDQCPQDDKISFQEYSALINDIDQDNKTYEQLVKSYEMLDLNNDDEISMQEFLQHLRVLNEPIDLQGSLPPFDPVRDWIIHQLRCNPQPGSDQYICKDGYTREDLKSWLPGLYPLDNILNDYVSFEDYVNREHALRDIDRNGMVERWEHEYHDNHYKTMRRFWNYSKGVHSDETLRDDGILTRDQWNQQDNPMIRRDYPNGEEIPQSDLDFRFNYYDKNNDGELSWWEYWSTIQASHVRYYHFHQLFYAIDVDQDEMLTRDELKAYFQNQNPVAPLAEIDAMIADFQQKYDAAGDVVFKWPMWNKYHREAQSVEDQRLRWLNIEYKFDQYVFYPIDLNRDKVLEHTEMIAQMSIDEANEIYQVLGKDPVSDSITYTELYDSMIGDTFMTRMSEFYAWLGPIYFTIPEEDRVGLRYITLDLLDINHPEAQQAYGVSTQAELEALFADIDKNGDGQFDKQEACLYYVGDHEYFCPADDYYFNQEIIQPDYAAYQQ